MTTAPASILVGVDFSDASRRALDHAISLSVKLGADRPVLAVPATTASTGEAPS